ncbi:hypothetical protein [Hyunsoonleella pacifica]|uniref:Uncharacterized protein n=1 Tax=Hyunsoonleella pacifica TaxID=1080224 RepID=A0A4Q9FSP4_9FLAO|nr:hypothetical protein [Hyunsoonleella pacifica]TBN17886.1 hypothetical protein EYD46_06140 [Hyunsoonleella pacifica]GGD08072.1 hypothetical protein GCM10011368_07550 [Hyunsoonleella pacifica]
MTRKEIEEKIINGFTDRIDLHGWSLLEKKFRGDHYADYGKRINGLDYRLSINFMKPSYLEYYNYVKIVSPEITNLYKTINTNFIGDCFEISSIQLNSIMHLSNINGIYKSTERAKHKIDDKPILNDLDINSLVQELYVRQYSFVANTIEERTNSLNKLNYLFNELPYENNDSTKPKMTSYSTFLVRQVLVGTLLAIHLDIEEKKILFNKYLDYSSKFSSGQNEDIDYMRIAIEKYS